MFYEFNHLSTPDYLKVERGSDGFSFPPHLHQCYELIFIKRGKMEVCVSGTAYTVNKGEAILIFPNLIHSLKSEESEHILLIFSPSLVQAYASKVSGKIPENCIFKPSDELTSAIESIEDKSLICKKGLMYSLCGEFDDKAAYKIRESDNGKLLYRIFAFVEKNYASVCTLSALAESTGYDYSYLSRFFRRAVGTAFNSYVDHYRLSKACYMLENSDLPVLQCAIESGFTSLRSFNRNFKEYYTVTPREYRKNMRK